MERRLDPDGGAETDERRPDVAVAGGRDDRRSDPGEDGRTDERRLDPGGGRETDGGPSTSAIRVECYARASTVAAPVDDAIRDLERLERSGAIDALDVRVWPDKLAIDGPASSSEAREAFERFRAWARQWGVSICPPFEVRKRASEITGETTETLVTPVLFVAVYAEGALVAVYPHSTDERTYRVADGIAELAGGEIAALGSTTPPAAPPDSGTCPGCGDRLTNGQGLFLCSACGWVGTVTDAGQYRRAPRLAASGPPVREEFADR